MKVIYDGMRRIDPEKVEKELVERYLRTTMETAQKHGPVRVIVENGRRLTNERKEGSDAPPTTE